MKSKSFKNNAVGGVIVWDQSIASFPEWGVTEFPTYRAMIFNTSSDVFVHDGAELWRRPLRRQVLVGGRPPAVVCPLLARQAGVHHRRGGPEGVGN